MNTEQIKNTYNTINIKNINTKQFNKSILQALTFDFYYTRTIVMDLYNKVCIENKTSILYAPLSKEKIS